MKKIASFLLAAFSCVLPLFAQEEKMNQFISLWQEHNDPVILVRELDTPLSSPEFKREGIADEPTRLVVGVVELSTTKQVKPGTLVFLELLTLGQPGAGEGASRYWIVNIAVVYPPNIIRLPTRINDSDSVIYIWGEFTYVWNGNVLKQSPNSLHGIWKQMLDKVSEQ